MSQNISTTAYCIRRSRFLAKSWRIVVFYYCGLDIERCESSPIYSAVPFIVLASILIHICAEGGGNERRDVRELNYLQPVSFDIQQGSLIPSKVR